VNSESENNIDILGATTNHPTYDNSFFAEALGSRGMSN